MSRKTTEQLLDMIGDVDERYIQEYIEAQAGKHKSGRTRIRLGIVLAATMIMLLGTVSLAATVPAIGNFLVNLLNEQRTTALNFDEIEAEYAVRIDDTHECDGVVGTLNSAIVEDHHLLLNYTFNWSGLEEAQNGSFHTYFLPWFFYIAEGDNIICQSEYTEDLHTQTYIYDENGDFENTLIYCIDLENVDGRELIGKELTVRLLYSENGKGFVSTFTPESCFTDRIFIIDKTYEFEEHRIVLDRIQESALYVTLFIDCATIGHSGDNYTFILSDESGNDYTVYPFENNDVNGYWFVKPKTIGSHLVLKVICSNLRSDPYGQILDDSYEILYEIPIELNTSF